MPKHLRLPRMDECQFYDKKRLEQLHRQEEQLFAEAKEKGDIPNDLTNYEVCALSSLTAPPPKKTSKQVCVWCLFLVSCAFVWLEFVRGESAPLGGF